MKTVRHPVHWNFGTFCITKACGGVGMYDDDKARTFLKVDGLPFKFRMLDGDGNAYFYGYNKTNNDNEAFGPLDDYGVAFGCTEIQYRNDGKWETL